MRRYPGGRRRWRAIVVALVLAFCFVYSAWLLLYFTVANEKVRFDGDGNLVDASDTLPMSPVAFVEALSSCDELSFVYGSADSFAPEPQARRQHEY
jgi:hypothetical protein